MLDCIYGDRKHGPNMEYLEPDLYKAEEPYEIINLFFLFT